MVVAVVDEVIRDRVAVAGVELLKQGLGALVRRPEDYRVTIVNSGDRHGATIRPRRDDSVSFLVEV